MQIACMISTYTLLVPWVSRKVSSRTTSSALLCVCCPNNVPAWTNADTFLKTLHTWDICIGTAKKKSRSANKIADSMTAKLWERKKQRDLHTKGHYMKTAEDQLVYTVTYIICFTFEMILFLRQSFLFSQFLNFIWYFQSFVWSFWYRSDPIGRHNKSGEMRKL